MATVTPTWTATTTPSAVALLTGSFSLALSEPAGLARAFQQGDRAVGAALARGVAAALPAATPDMVDITGVSLDGRLLSSAVAGVEAGSGPASVHVSFQAAMPAASALAANFSALVFSRAADWLEASLALELATGALNFTVLGVGDLEATLELVAVGTTLSDRTTTLSDTAENAVGSHAAGILALSVALGSVCVAVCCVGIGAFTWRRGGGCWRRGGHKISDHDVVPAVQSGTSTATEQLTEPSLVLQVQLSPREEDGDEPTADLGSCQVADPGGTGQPWRLKLGDLATVEGSWEMPWASKEWQPLVELSSLVDVTYKYRPELPRGPGPPPRAAESSASTQISL